MKGDDSASTDTFLLQGLPFVQFTLNKGLRSHEIISLLGCLVNGRIHVLIYAPINVNLLGGAVRAKDGDLSGKSRMNTIFAPWSNPHPLRTLSSPSGFTSLGALHI